MAKEDEVKKAMEKRHEIEKSHQEAEKSPDRIEDRMNEDELDTFKDAAAEKAEGKAQAKAHIADGKVDLEARGDVKGDGGDAKDYPDDDPDKYKSPPTYEYGLNETRAGVDVSRPREEVISDRTAAEQARGAETQKGHQAARDRAAAEAEKSKKSKE